MAPKPLEGTVVLVLDAAAELGRALALELSARGAAVVCAGPVERDVARVVGEIAFGGGRARHLVVALDDEAAVVAAQEQAASAFGAPHLVLAGSAHVPGLAPPSGADDLEARARAFAVSLATSLGEGARA